MRSTAVLSVLIGALAAAPACDGNNATSGTEDVVETTPGEDATTPPADTTPLDTALPDIGNPNENKDLRNGITVRIGHIIDGDTFDVWVGTFAPRKYVIRMLGLSAPECLKGFVTDNWGGGQACTSDDELYGLASYQTLVAMLADKTVKLTCDVGTNEWCKTDDYDRYLAYVAVDGKDAATEMARAGAAFSYVEFASSKRGDICRAEFEAKDAKRGIWALGDLNYILSHMSSYTSNWYKRDHDSKCKAAMN